MLNPYPCIVWPLVLLAALLAYRMWKKRRGLQNSWLMPIAFFVATLLILWSVVGLQFERFWVDGLFLVYIPQ